MDVKEGGGGEAGGGSDLNIIFMQWTLAGKRGICRRPPNILMC